MDISRVLSPCSSQSPPPPHEAVQPVKWMDTSKSVTIESASAGYQRSVTSRRTTSSGRQSSAQSTHRKRTADASKKIHTQPFFPVKRKRKRRLSAQQKQVMRENQQDESRIYNLTLDVNELKQQVRNLLMHKRVFETRELAQKKVSEARALVVRQVFNAAVLRTTQRFFEIFRSGFREWKPEEDAFLAATIDKDITVASGVSGADAFFEQWRRYTKLLQVHFEDTPSIRILVSDSEACVVECMGELKGRLALPAIKAMFPHVLQDPELLSKVIDCRLTCPTRTLLYFGASGRIVQYDANVDFYAGLNRSLPTNPMDVITLMSNARISSDGWVIPDLDDEQVEKTEDTDLTGLDAGAKESDAIPSSHVGPTTLGSLAPVTPSRSTCSSRSSVGYILY